jgi:acetyl esterase/lipase
MMNRVTHKVPAGVMAVGATVGGIPGEWLRSAKSVPVGTLLYLHGGGYFACSPETHRPITAGFARAGLDVFAPAYRLAPEHPFPAAIDDALAAYRGLLASGIPAGSITVAGDSAGGGLALALLLSLRDAGDHLPVAAMLFSPWTDLAGTGASLQSNSDRDAMFAGEGMDRAAAPYLAGEDPRHPLASPLYADLGRLPPLLIHVGSYEVLLDDSTRLADRARAAGTAVKLRTWPVVPHVWQLFPIPEAVDSMAQAASFLRDALRGSPDQLAA